MTLPRLSNACRVLGLSLCVFGLNQVSLAQTASPDVRRVSLSAGFTAIAIRFQPDRERLVLLHTDTQNQPLKTFKRARQFASQQGWALHALMNAGMYHSDFRPVGLLVIDRVTRFSLNERKFGFGNFFLQPNGVFAVNSAQQAAILPTENYTAWATQQRLAGTPVELATQSGPLLVSRGHLHPKIDPRSHHLNIRNAIALCRGQTYFVLTEQPVTFYQLATGLQRQLHCDDVLYLDGSVSSLSLPNWSIQRDQLGPMLGIIQRVKP